MKNSPPAEFLCLIEDFIEYPTENCLELIRKNVAFGDLSAFFLIDDGTKEIFHGHNSFLRQYMEDFCRNVNNNELSETLMSAIRLRAALSAVAENEIKESENE